MKKFLLILFFTGCAKLSPSTDYVLMENTVIVLADKQKGIELISQPDYYTENFGGFDLASKVTEIGNATMHDYLQYASEQVRDWTVPEQSKLAGAIEFASEQIKKFSLNLNLPDTVYIIKTTGREEGGAGGYTRSDYIVLNESTLRGSEFGIVNLFLHELFHVLSRSDEIARERLYNVIGFHKCNNISLPEDIFNMKISNPDVPFFDYYVKLTKTNGTEFEGIMVIYSDREFEGGSFFSYLNIGFIKVEGDDFDKRAVVENGETVIIPLEGVIGFFDLIGSNTEYIINPEEIVAENFVLMMMEANEIPNPEIPNKFLEILQK